MNLGRNVCLLALACASFACSTSKVRGPAGKENELTLSQILEQVRTANIQLRLDKKECSGRYGQIYQNLFELAGDSAYLDLNDIQAIDQDLSTAFHARLSLKESFKDFKIDSDADNECLKAATDVLRGLRYVEDYLVEIRTEKAPVQDPEEFRALEGSFPYLMINPKFSDQFKSSRDLLSGDVLLSRGNAYSSAAIARIGRNDYQFSHLSFVYKDPDSQELFTTEAHIEIGSVVNPISDHLGGKNAREVVFRHSDQVLAHQASLAIYKRVLELQAKNKTIEYDFSMNLSDDSRLFCSEVISTGFNLASPGFDLPMFKSKFTPGIIPFLAAIGVPATQENIQSLQTFSPGDIQLDPRFELVAEWRNPKKTEESRIKDFILTALFEKMDKENYRFDPTLKMDLEAKSLWLLRRTPLVKKFLTAKFPLNMNPTQLQLFMVLDKVGDALYREIEVASLEYDRPMTPKEIYDTVDAFWKKDALLYKKHKKGQDVQGPLFHKYFHP